MTEQVESIYILCWEAVRVTTATKNRHLLDPGHVALQPGRFVYGFFPTPGRDPKNCPGMMMKQSRNEFVGYLVNKIWDKKRKTPELEQAEAKMVIHLYSVVVPSDIALALKRQCETYFQRCQATDEGERPPYRERDHNCIHLTTSILQSVRALDFSAMRPVLTPDAFRKRVLDRKLSRSSPNEKGVITAKDSQTIVVDP